MPATGLLGAISTGQQQGSIEDRVVAATGRCVARWGFRRTNIEEIAASAGISRATVYRLFPGGKQALVAQAAQVEVARFFDRFTARLGGAADPEEWLTVGLAEAAAAMSEDAPVRALLLATVHDDDPDDPFAGMGHMVEMVATAAAPYAARFVRDGHAPKVAEWLVRVALSYTTCPSPDYDLRQPAAVTALVRDFVMPSLVDHLRSPPPTIRRTDR